MARPAAFFGAKSAFTSGISAVPTAARIAIGDHDAPVESRKSTHSPMHERDDQQRSEDDDERDRHDDDRLGERRDVARNAFMYSRTCSSASCRISTIRRNWMNRVNPPHE